MGNRQHFSLIFIFLLIKQIFSCSFTISNEKNPDGIWDESEYTRKLSATPCTCGAAFNGERQEKRWNLYVHAKIAEAPTRIKTCTGTIIASNLIVTSHKCLTLEGKEMNVYDMWKPKGGSNNVVVDKDNYLVTKRFWNNIPAGKEYPVKEIIFNAHYAHNSAQKERYPTNDIMIIVLEEDLFANGTHVPICVPPFSENLQSEILGQKAMYYGAGRGTDSLLELRENLIIRGGSKLYGCDHEENNFEDVSIYKTLCIDYTGVAPSDEGGPLLIHSDAKPSLPYLVGIASKTRLPKRHSGNEFHAQFSSVITSVKYLEYQANRQNSQWCTTPPLKLRKPGLQDDERPWEGLTSVVRDESLDCVCGKRNVKPVGRIVGGVEATPFEFGWMSLVLVRYPNRPEIRTCGGSIINDRMILTAAHCILYADEHEQKQKPFPPEDVLVKLFIHNKFGDDKTIEKLIKSVLYHPDYKELDWHNYYDYDIALLILNEPLIFSEDGNGINTICLPKLESPVALLGKTATVAGWGRTDPDNGSSGAIVLQKIEVPIRELSVCSDIAYHTVTDRFLCAGTLDRWKDSAKGDSGGPLMIEYDKTQWFQVGIVSYGEDVEVEQPIGVLTAALYTDVHKMLPYIDYHARRLKAKWCKSKPG
ncbi:unnamed protein product [Orchesella dallaii]|uniref:Peptidase S1 domain-containing protein n=1 Tax=Orchesella dallaii TaxID=48710 RepID=A0ABP1Q313_9HEXA